MQGSWQAGGGGVVQKVVAGGSVKVAAVDGKALCFKGPLAHVPRPRIRSRMASTSWNPSIPPPSQSKLQIGLNSALLMPHFGMGGWYKGWGVC